MGPDPSQTFTDNQPEDEAGVHLDPTQNPDATNRAVAKLLNPNDEVLIELPPDGTVTLPGGYVHFSDGKLYTDAEVRELTGNDEEMLAKPEVSKNLARFTQLLLQRGVTRVGPFENPSNGVLGSLLLGDRDMLLMAIRIATYGPDLEMSVECPACNETLEVKYDLRKDIPIKPMENPMERQFTVTLRNGTELTAILAVGTDQEAILSAGPKATVPELNTLLLSRCLTTIEGNSLGAEKVRQLGIVDRRKLLEAITEKQPGPKYQQLDLECPTCAKEFPLSLTLMDLFR